MGYLRVKEKNYRLPSQINFRREFNPNNKIQIEKLQLLGLLVAEKLPPISSSSSYRAGSTDIPDPLSSLLPIVHRPR